MTLTVLKVKVKVKLLSRVRLFATPWTVAHQTSPSMGFSRQEYWSGLPFPSPGDLPDPGIELRSPAFQADALTSIHGVAKSRTQRGTALSLFTFMHWRRKWHPTPVFLPGESQGWGSLVGCRLWGHTELDTTEVT